MSDQNRNDKKRGLNAWKRYGAIFMAGIIMTGTAVGACFTPETVYAEEEQRITMRVAEDEERRLPQRLQRRKRRELLCR